MAEIIEERVREYLDAATGATVDEAKLKDLWIGIGVGIEKRQLLTGQPTAITKQYTGMTDAELDALIVGLEGANVAGENP